LTVKTKPVIRHISTPCKKLHTMEVTYRLSTRNETGDLEWRNGLILSFHRIQ